ncbi:alkaline phosphatase family protein [uncultured Vagococcus sp.]|uniref:alkaline phosphatase family protein n=1 Tax=uncultured Vagococcus sp. TaxID=189676 RepID=UPI0028D5C236|nr:alkaline phosphatase family protein [uncultured Vagococcus sp.]
MLKNKVIMVILDGCRYDTAVGQMGFLNSLVTHQKAQLTKVIAEMPSNSRPLYEVLMTGTPMHQNQIYTNLAVQRSKELSIFDLVKKAGGTTAVAGYYWLSELYNQAPYNIMTDRIQHDREKLIQHGIFYSEDHYPDSHVFADANALVNDHQPDFMVVHSMNIDDVGHKYTANSKEYMTAVNYADIILGYFIPVWQKLGYQIIVTADHGMDQFGLHGGSLNDHREVPLFYLGDFLTVERELSQLAVMPLVCQLLGMDQVNS